MVFYDYSYEYFSVKHKSQNEFIFRDLRTNDYPEFSYLLTCQKNEETIFQPIFDIQKTAERIKNGEYCFICEDQRKIVGYVWFASKKKYIQEIQSTLLLGNSEVYSYNGYILKSHRGQNILQVLRDVGRKELISRGFKREITARMNWNLSAKRAILKSDFTSIGSVTVGFFLTFRYIINKCNKVHLINEGSFLEFYSKCLQKMKITL